MGACISLATARAEGTAKDVSPQARLTPEDVKRLTQQSQELKARGDYAGAIKIWENIASGLSEIFGPDHPNVATGLNGLAGLYQDQGEFIKAEALYQRSLLIREKSLGPDHPDVAISLNNLAGLYHDQGKYSKAEPLFLRSLLIREKALGPENLAVALSLNNLALLYRDQGNYARAEELIRRSHRIREKLLGADNPDVALSLNNLAGIYSSQGHYDKAEPLYQRSLLIWEKALGPMHPNVAASLSNIASLYQDQGQYSKAEPLLLRSLRIRETALGPRHPNVATILNNLAGLYRKQGQYKKSELLYQRALMIWEDSLGPGHPTVATVLSNLGVLYTKRGIYSKAEQLLRRSLLIREKTLGPDHPEVALALGNLAQVYLSQDLDSKAEPLFARSLKIQEKALGPSHPEVATTLNNLALLYEGRGQYGTAEILFQRSLSVDEMAFGAEHYRTANTLNNLSLLYLKQGRINKARLLLERSLRAKEKSLKADHPDIAASLNGLGGIYQAQGRFREAEQLFKRSLSMKELVLGGKHPDVALVLNNLGELYRGQGHYGKAEPLLRRSLSISEKALGLGHSAVAIALNNLGLLYQDQGRYDKAELLYKRAALTWEQVNGLGDPATFASIENLASLYQEQGRFSANIRMLEQSHDQQVKWLGSQLPLLPSWDRNAQRNTLGQAWGIPFDLVTKEPSAPGLALKIRLNRQGLLQEIEQRQALLLRASPTAKEQVGQLQALTKQLASVSLPPERRSALRQERDQLQAALYRQLPDLELQSVSVQDVAKSLPADGALVEFQRFQPFNGKQPPGKRWGTARYLALFLRPNGTITAVQLGQAQPIDAAILRALQASAGNTSDAMALWGKVSQLVLQPLQPHLAGSRQWFISPDGELNRVPFAAIPSPQQPVVPLAQAVQLRQLTTGRDLLRLQRPTKAGEKPLVMANPSYDRAQAQAPVIAAATGSAAERPQQRSSGIDSTRWAPLPATQLEGQQVAALLGTQPVTGPQATAMALQQRQGPRVLHIASHGFFAPDQDTPPSDPLRAVQDSSRQLRGFQGEDPQLRSGLVLAGANQPDADPNDDGYLTAAEATGLQLDGTELVTLSACSTAQGAIKTGEGVYGLQRSLTVAGARSTLLSLWKVDDAATAEFMQRFYKRLKAGEGRADALQAVQQEFRTDPTLKARGWDSIFYWGAWQLVGDWRPIQGL